MGIKKHEKKKNSPILQILSYPLILPKQKELKESLEICKEVANEYLKKGYCDKILTSLRVSKIKAYKVLEKQLEKIRKLPSRINRGILEIVGRTLRAVNDRKSLFEVLMKMEADPDKWNYKKLIEHKEIYKKSQYIENIKEQTKNYIQENKKPPENYYDIQKPPQLKQAIITYAPDDGQAIKIIKNGSKLKIKLKCYMGEEKNKWNWIEVNIDLPKQLENLTAAPPDLRYACIHGEWRAVLDYKVRVKCQEKQKDGNFITIDWGTKKLLTICVFDNKGNQISLPIFLKFKPLKQKLERIRKEIDNLKSKRDTLHKNSTLWRKYNREIAKRWRKYRAINKSLTHLASNIAIIIAKIYNCSGIYIEWLKSLKSKNKSRQLNWIINNTVRQAIYDKLAYKAKLAGITLHKPIPPNYTSQYCPRCGGKGFHTKSSDTNIKRKFYGWFKCPHCSFNADRDYVACCNLARKALYGNSLKNQNKAVVYMKTCNSDLLYCQGSSLYGELAHNLSGWKKSVYLKHPFSMPLKL
jgi:transposase